MQAQQKAKPPAKEMVPEKAQEDPWLVEKVRVIDPGRIESIHVAPGDYVEAGAPLVTLDHYRQKHSLAVAKIRATDKSALRTAGAELALRQSILEEMRQRARRRLVSDQQVKQAEAQVDASQAKVEAADSNQQLSELDLEMAQIHYDNRFLKSPISGVVLTVEKEKGETVAAGFIIVTVADSSHWKTKVNVDAATAEKLRKGGFVPAILGGKTRQNGEILQILPSKDGGYVVEFLFRNNQPQQLPETTTPEFQFSEIKEAPYQPPPIVTTPETP